MRIEELTLPSSLKQLLMSEGYDELYPPQADAVNAGVLEGRNLVLASPTASGKTLIAELALMKHILLEGGKALYLTPLRALASEKLQEFKKYGKLEKQRGQRVKIGVTSGDYDAADHHLGNCDIIVATNEKADSLVRHKARWLKELSIVVADEVHLLTDVERGPTLEVVLTRLRALNPKLQLLALSATVKNAEELAEWLGAQSVTTEWRPVPLKEGVYCEGEIQFKDGGAKTVPQTSHNPVLDIACEAVRSGGQALIFTETRRAAVETGRKAGLMLARTVTRPDERSLSLLAERILAAGETTGLAEELAKQVKTGSAFHHAGLAGIHRRLVEDAFRDGKVKILAATPTLAAGVNLPARTVIVSSHERYEFGYGRQEISVLEFKQFCGRAGRPKYDDFGEAVLVASSQDEQDYLMDRYVLSEPERLWSKLGVERVLRPHVLATIASGFAYTEPGLLEFFRRTFYAHQYGPKLIKGRIGEILLFLTREKMVEADGEEITATAFGRRVSELYIDPFSAVLIRDGLYNRPREFTDLSLLHLISRTPDLSPKLHPRRGELETLEAYASEHRNELTCEIPEPYFDDGIVSYDEFLAEVKCARVLTDCMNEFTEDDILKGHKVEPGDLMRLTEMADWLLYATNELGQLFGHSDIRKQIGQLRVRVVKGVKTELLPLVRIQGIGRVRARVLYNAGYKSVSDLKRARIEDLVKVPLIGSKLAKKIKEQAGGLIKAEEWEQLKAGTAEQTEQTLLTEYESGR